MTLFFSRSVGPAAGDLLGERLATRNGKLSGPLSSTRARKSSAWWAAARLRADLVSTMPIDVYRRVNGVQVEQQKPPVLVTPEGGRSLMTDWMYATTIDLDQCGNTVGVIRAVDGLGLPSVIELAPIEDVTIRRDKQGAVTYRIGSKVYQRAEVWHERQHIVAGSPVGLSPLAHAALAMDPALSAAAFAAEWFSNNAVPAAGLKNTAKTLTPGEASLVKARFKASIVAGDPFVHGKDWEYSLLAGKQNEAAFLAAIGAGGAEAARYLGVPGDMIDVPTQGSSITYANITQRNLQLFIINIGPAIYRREQAMSAWLLPKPRYLKINPGALLRMDLAGRYDSYAVGIQNKFLAPSEARDLEDRPPLTPEQLAEFDSLSASAPALPPRRDDRYIIGGP